MSNLAGFILAAAYFGSEPERVYADLFWMQQAQQSAMVGGDWQVGAHVPLLCVGPISLGLGGGIGAGEEYNGRFQNRPRAYLSAPLTLRIVSSDVDGYGRPSYGTFGMTVLVAREMVRGRWVFGAGVSLGFGRRK